MITNKTIKGATKQYIDVLRMANGNGLKKEYIFQVLKNVAVHGVDVELLQDVVSDLKQVDKDMNTRYNRNIIAMFGRLIKFDAKKAQTIATELTANGLDGVGYSELVNAFKVVKSGFKALEKSGERSDKTEQETGNETAGTAKTAKTAGATAEPVVDVAEEVKSVRDELINRASELAGNSDDDLTDKYLELAAAVEEALEDFDPKKSKTTTAMVVTLMEKLHDTLSA